MKVTTKLALTMTLALVLMVTTALAATILFSPRYDALQLADEALLTKYGITEEMQPALHHTITETDDTVIVSYEMVESNVMRENRFGVYTVTVQDDKTEATWSMDGMDTTGGLDAPAWGAEQLLMYVQDYSTVMSYMETRDMLMNAPLVTPAPAGMPDMWELDKQTALSMAKISLEEAATIGREAALKRYGLTEQQANKLVRYDGTNDFEDESTYKLVDGRPLVNLFFHLTQEPGYQNEEGYYIPGEWQEKDGIYVVTVNLLDGTVEDIFYDTGLLGNG